MGNDTASTATTGLRERARRRRLESIRAAAGELFASKGFEAVSTKEVAEQAGVGEATLFRYVPSKTDLLLLVVGERVSDLVTQLEAQDRQAPRADGRSYVDRVDRVYAARAHMYVQDPLSIAAFMLQGLDAQSGMRSQSVAAGDRSSTW